MILAVIISAALLAFLPLSVLALRNRKAKKDIPTGPQSDIESVMQRLLTDKKQQQLVPEQIVRPVLACGASLTIVDERLEFGSSYEWLLAGTGTIRKAILWTEILKLPTCAN